MDTKERTLALFSLLLEKCENKGKCGAVVRFRLFGSPPARAGAPERTDGGEAGRA